ncbi:MAG: ribose-phosphate pyrophosphokinase-like domain-containing protein, partial [Treponema sp.]|nr:ribose-phosphate pyrophosphokinase-like domain-containing protein [Treponema sp.]
MNYSNPVNLGILACPGGEVFADKVVTHLRKGYRKKLQGIAADMARRYGMDNGEVIRQINFINDAVNLRRVPGPAGEIRVPRFRVPARFTSFANGEVKTEILESVRGKDIYIIQDVENHYPVNFNDGSDKKVLTVNDHLVTVLVTVDAAMQAGAGQVTVVLPTYPYARQHKTKGREGLTASRVG